MKVSLHVASRRVASHLESFDDLSQPRRLRHLVQREQVVALNLDALERSAREPFPPEYHLAAHLSVFGAEKGGYRKRKEGSAGSSAVPVVGELVSIEELEVRSHYALIRAPQLLREDYLVDVPFSGLVLKILLGQRSVRLPWSVGEWNIRGGKVREEHLRRHRQTSLARQSQKLVPAPRAHAVTDDDVRHVNELGRLRVEGGRTDRRTSGTEIDACIAADTRSRRTK